MIIKITIKLDNEHS